jgi:hypothetical protein
METIGLLCLSSVGLVVVIGFFLTKTQGWGTYSSSTLILIVGLFVAAILLILGKIEGITFANALFAVIGYGGGLIASNKA